MTRRDGALTVPARQGIAGRLRRAQSVRLVVALLTLAGLLLTACGDGQAEQPSSGPTSEAAAPEVTASPRQQAQAQTATTTRAATATRTATRTAATPAVTRTPAQTPTPIPPPEPAIGDTIETDGWKLTIIGFDLYQSVGDSTASGVFLYLRMSIENTASEPRAFPFDGLVVIDVNDTSYFLSEPPTRETLTYDFGFEIDEQLAAGASQSVAAVFDIAPDATGLVLTTPSRVFQIRIEYDEAPK
ncbi:MAG TPA: hypothetical protein VEX37_07270 [Thermomicrobiales bacterium]|nr:hypothetical protein [Thermomicrobiales bacterium]